MVNLTYQNVVIVTILYTVKKLLLLQLLLQLLC